MKVLLVNRNSKVEGGADKVFINTVKKLQEKGISVDTFTRDSIQLKQENPRDLTLKGKITHASQYFYNKQVAKSLEQKIQEFKPDLAHIHLIFGTLSLSVLKVLRKHRVPVVMTIHDYRLICPANAMLDRHGNVCEKCTGGKYHKCLTNRCAEGHVLYSTIIMVEGYLRKWVTKPIKLIDHFIFVSQFAQNKHIQKDQRFKMKSSLLYNMGSRKEKVEGVRGEYFLYFGRLSEEKGIRTLLAAAKASGVRLQVAGSGPLESLMTASGLEYIGFKKETDLEKIILESSFVVLASEWYENNPMTIVEAFSLGKPVIGANIGGIPELVNEETGLLFESGNVDSLVEALKKANDLSDEAYHRMSQSCYQFYLDHFEPEQHIADLVSIYKSVIPPSPTIRKGGQGDRFAV